MYWPEYTLLYDCECDNWPLREELSSSVQLAALLSLVFILSVFCY